VSGKPYVTEPCTSPSAHVAQEGQACRRVACRLYLRGAAGRCAAIEAGDGPLTLRRVATLLGVSREGVRKIEAIALAKVRATRHLPVMTGDSFAHAAGADADHEGPT
jgi:hypothetical protein